MAKRMAFVIDLKRCIGCDTCILGCKVENELPAGRSRVKVYDEGRAPIYEKPQGSFPKVSQYWLPNMCQHCEDAPCIQACPTNTLWKRDDDGLVMLDEDKCIGCLRCAEACPYDALTFDPVSGVADKCTMCEHRLSVGLAPSCALVCPTRAIYAGDLNDPQSKVSELLRTRESRVLNEAAGAGPNIYYLAP